MYEDQLSREAVKGMLKEINRKMFTAKKEAIGRFLSYMKTSQPKLSESTVEFLLMGDKKLQGVTQVVATVNWKGSFHKYTNVLLDLLQFILSPDFEHNVIARKVFLNLPVNRLSGLHLYEHLRKKSGNRHAAEWILQFCENEGIKVEMSKEFKKKHGTSSSMDLSSVSNMIKAPNAGFGGRAQSVIVSTTRMNDHASNTCITGDSKRKKGFMKYLSGFFHKRPDQKVLQKQGILKAAGVFGAPLSEVVRIHGKQGLPAVIVDCVTVLRTKHLLHEGLFRIPGNNTNIIALKQRYDYGGQVDLNGETANDVSGLLKLYLRDMPEPLFPWEFYDEFLNAFERKSVDGGQAIRYIVSSIPEPRRRLIKYLFEYLFLLSLNSSVHKMAPRNLAICLAPNILRPEVETLQTVALHAPAVTGVVSFLIEDANPKKKSNGTSVAEVKSSNPTAAPSINDRKKRMIAIPEGSTVKPQIKHKANLTYGGSSSNLPHLKTENKSKRILRSSTVQSTTASTLPRGWREEYSKEGKKFYYNPEKGISQWARPKGPSIGISRTQSEISGMVNSPKDYSPAGPGPRKPPPFRKKKGTKTSPSSPASPVVQPSTPRPSKNTEGLPDGWAVYTDKTSKKVYYHHAATNKTQWMKPT